MNFIVKVGRDGFLRNTLENIPSIVYSISVISATNIYLSLSFFISLSLSPTHTLILFGLYLYYIEFSVRMVQMQTVVRLVSCWRMCPCNTPRFSQTIAFLMTEIYFQKKMYPFFIGFWAGLG